MRGKAFQEKCNIPDPILTKKKFPLPIKEEFCVKVFGIR